MRRGLPVLRMLSDFLLPLSTDASASLCPGEVEGTAARTTHVYTPNVWATHR